LIFAAGGGHIDVVQLLLDRGADVDASNHVNVTALRVAMSKGHAHVIHLLETAVARKQKTKGERPAEDSNDRLALQGAEDFSSLKLEKAVEPISSCESELQRRAEKREEDIPPTNGTPLSHPDLESQSRALVQVSDTMERVIAALAALRCTNPAPTQTVSVADIAHKIMLTLPEAAMLTGLSRNHLRQAIEKGMLKAKNVERGWRVKRTDLDHYVENL
jgi:excisionase family DNA binding protein